MRSYLKAPVKNSRNSTSKRRRNEESQWIKFWEENLLLILVPRLNLKAVEKIKQDFSRWCLMHQTIVLVLKGNLLAYTSLQGHESGCLKFSNMKSLLKSYFILLKNCSRIWRETEFKFPQDLFHPILLLSGTWKISLYSIVWSSNGQQFNLQRMCFCQENLGRKYFEHRGISKLLWQKRKASLMSL